MNNDQKKVLSKIVESCGADEVKAEIEILQTDAILRNQTFEPTTQFNVCFTGCVYQQIFADKKMREPIK